MDARHYYIVTPGSEAWNFMLTYRKEHLARYRVICRVIKKLGLPKDITVRGNTGRVFGFGSAPFDPPKPDWKWCKKRSCNVPTSTVDGKINASIIKGIPHQTSQSDISNRLFKTGLVLGGDEGGCVIRFAGFGWFGSLTKAFAYIGMHNAVKNAAKHWPEGLVEVTATQLDEQLKDFCKKHKIKRKET